MKRLSYRHSTAGAPDRRRNREATAQSERALPNPLARVEIDAASDHQRRSSIGRNAE